MTSTSTFSSPTPDPEQPKRPNRLPREAWETANRRAQLFVHAMLGLIGGTLILFTGTAAELQDVTVAFRPITGVLALVGGGLLLSGVTASRQPRLEIFGLSVLAAWHAVMVIGLVVGLFVGAGAEVSWPWNQSTELEAARLYPIAVFTALLLMVSLHLFTIQQLRASQHARDLARKNWTI